MNYKICIIIIVYTIGSHLPWPTPIKYIVIAGHHNKHSVSKYLAIVENNPGFSIGSCFNLSALINICVDSSWSGMSNASLFNCSALMILVNDGRMLVE